MTAPTSHESTAESAPQGAPLSANAKARGLDQRRLPILLGVILSMLLALPAVWPLAQPGLPQTHDALFHLGRLIEIRETMAVGDLFPRWVQPFTEGLGFPFLNFYAPLSYYLALSVTLLGLSEAEAFKLASALMPSLAAATMYLWVVELLRSQGARGQSVHIPALAAGAVYAYTPYQLVEIYVRGALAESMALALMPLLFYSQDRLLRRPRPSAALVAGLILGALLLTHNVMALLGLALSLGYSLVSLAVERRRDPQAGAGANLIRPTLAYFALAIGLGMGLSAFFWLPAMLERGYLSFEQLSTGWFSPVRHLKDSWPPVQGSILFDFRNPYRIALMQILSTLPGMAFLFVRVWPKQRRRESLPSDTLPAIDWLAAFFFLIAGLIVFLLTPASTLVWRSMPLLKSMQFPWRTLGLFALAGSFLVGFGLYCVGRRWPRALPVVGVVVVVSFATGGLVGLPVNMGRTPVLDAGSIQQMTSLAGWGLKPAAPQMVPSTIAAGELSSLRAMEQKPGRIKLELETFRATEIALHLLYFPGWRVFVDGQETPPFPIAPRGLLGFSLPEGRHFVDVRFERTPLRAGAEAVSLVSLILLVVMLAVLAARRQAVVEPTLLALVLVSLLVLPRWTAQPLPASQFQPVSLPASTGIRLLGMAAEQPNNGRLGLTFYWQALRSLGDLDIFVSLVDDQGNSAGRPARKPVEGAYPTADWQPGEIVVDRVELDYPPNLNANNLRLNVGFRPPDPTNSSSPIAAFRVPLDGSSLTPQRTPPPTVFGDLLGLDAFALASPLAQPGENLSASLLWRAVDAIPGNLSVYLHVLDASGKKAWAQEDWPAGPESYPAVLWAKGESVREERRLTIAKDTPPGRYSLYLGTYRYPDVRELPVAIGGQPPKQSALMLGNVFVVAPQTRRGSVDPQYSAKANFGDRLELVGFDLSSKELRPGQKLNLTTYWRPIRPTPVDYTIFAQFVDASGTLRGQNDGQPADGSYPTSLWQAGEYVVDARAIALESTSREGPYRLIVGLYQWPSMERLPAMSGGRAIGNAVELTTISRY